MRKKLILALALALALMPALAVAQPLVQLPKPELTEFWSPVPPKVEPGATLGQVRPSCSSVQWPRPDGMGKRQWRAGRLGRGEWRDGDLL